MVGSREARSNGASPRSGARVQKRGSSDFRAAERTRPHAGAIQRAPRDVVSVGLAARGRTQHHLALTRADRECAARAARGPSTYADGIESRPTRRAATHHTVSVGATRLSRTSGDRSVPLEASGWLRSSAPTSGAPRRRENSRQATWRVRWSTGTISVRRAFEDLEEFRRRTGAFASKNRCAVFDRHARIDHEALIAFEQHQPTLREHLVNVLFC